MESKTPPSPGRPRGFVREEALERAMELFWRQGYEGVSMADLKSEIGIAAPSLYSAFGCKADLYRAALDLYQQRQAAPRDELEQPGALKQVISRFMHAAVRAATDPDRPSGCMISSGMFASAPANRAEAEATAALRQDVIALLKKRLQRARTEGELPTDANPAALARYLAAVLQGISMQARDGASRRELNAIVEQALVALPG